MGSSVSPAGRLYAMQTGMKLDSKTPECRKFLVKLMDQLESVSGSGAKAVFLLHHHPVFDLQVVHLEAERRFIGLFCCVVSLLSLRDGFHLRYANVVCVV